MRYSPAIPRQFWLRCAPSRRESPRSACPCFVRKPSLPAVLTCVFGAPALAQPSAPPAMPLMPITLEGNAERGSVIAETCKGCHGIPGYYNASPAYHVPKLGRPERRLHRSRAAGLSRGRAATTRCRRRLPRCRIRDMPTSPRSSPISPVSRNGPNHGVGGAIEAGRTKAVSCVACHGPEGVAAASRWRTPPAGTDLLAPGARPLQERQSRRPRHEPGWAAR